MVETVRVAILDYTPLEYTKYSEQLARDVLVSAMRDSAPGDVLVCPEYIRGFKDGIPGREFDMFLIAGSPLSPLEHSKDLDIVLGQINEIIDDVPVLGICFGLHAIANITGNGSRMIKDFDIGPKEVQLYSDIEGVGKYGERLLFPVNHAYKITNGNNALKVLAVSNGGIQIADATEFFNGNPVMGLQFHPEFAATMRGWQAFRKIYGRTLQMIIDRECDATLYPVLDALDGKVRRRLLETVPGPESLIGKELTREQRDLLMSPFHDIDLRKKLLGKKESERTHRQLRQNCTAVIGHFIKRVVAKRIGMQLEMQRIPKDSVYDLNHVIEMEKIARKGGLKRLNEKRPFRRPEKQVKIRF